MNRDDPVGIFDSGIGGLTVAAAIHRLLPNEETIYLGDTARVPYGPKSPATVTRYSREILDWLLAQRVKAVVVACNTATAHALPALAAIAPVPVLGVVEPGAKAAVKVTNRGAIGVIGTAGTIASGAYRRALLNHRDNLAVREQPCPLFVPLVEEGWIEHPAARLIAEEYLRPFGAGNIDTLVLGCTHYPLLKQLIADTVGADVQLIDSATETARELATVLTEANLVTRRTTPGIHRWAATDDIERFQLLGSRFTGRELGPVELVNLEAGSA